MNHKRWRIELEGRLQGVGFRPLVWHLAKSLDVQGSVCNTAIGVCIEAQATENQLDEFMSGLASILPSLARIDSQVITEISTIELANSTKERFEIQESQGQSSSLCDALPDLATCQACLSELFNLQDRRYLYPLISCTQCGPRFSIQKSAPFDRPRTTLDPFPLCQDCQFEYADPSSRRFHAQTIGCFQCGPQWTWTQPNAIELACDQPHKVENMLTRFERTLRAGGIVLVKGVGGYQFLCDASSEQAVLKLRRLKRRESKPFAVLVATLQQALEVGRWTAGALVALQGTHRPIVIARRRPHSASEQQSQSEPCESLGIWVSELSCSLGVMLPNNPMQMLLAHRFGQPMVVTSSNDSGEPMLIDDEQAIERFGSEVEAILQHDRGIVQPLDDPIVCDTTVGLIPIRMGRGNTPCRLAAIANPAIANPAIALGADLKAAWAFSKPDSIYLMQHLGDASHPGVSDRIEKETLAMLESYPQIRTIVTDLHPGYRSTLIGQRLAAGKSPWLQSAYIYQSLQHQSLQHHAAHLGALAVDVGLDVDELLLGFVFDGTGYGSDGTLWGGELMASQGSDVMRLGHLRNSRLPSGDVAAKNPWRSALALLLDAEIDVGQLDKISDWPQKSPWGGLSTREQEVLLGSSNFKAQAIPSSSMGRWLDGIASLLGLVHVSDYEGHAAMVLEDRATWEDTEDGAYEFLVTRPGRMLEFDGRDVLRSVLEDIRLGTSIPRIARRVHLSIARLLVEAVGQLPNTLTQSRRLGLTGGVFQNRLLLEFASKFLMQAGWQVYIHRQVPPNDSSIAVGQLNRNWQRPGE